MSRSKKTIVNVIQNMPLSIWVDWAFFVTYIVCLSLNFGESQPQGSHEKGSCVLEKSIVRSIADRRTTFAIQH